MGTRPVSVTDAQEALAGEVRQIGFDAGLDAVGIAAAEPFTATRGHIEQRKQAGLHGGMNFTYRNPARSTEPGRIVPGRGRWSWGLGGIRPPRPPESRPGGARAPWPGTPRRTTTTRCRRRCSPSPTGSSRPAGSARWWPTTTPWSTARPPTGPGSGWYGKNTNLLLPGPGLVVRARLRWSPTRRSAGRRRSSRRRLRRLPPLPAGAARPAPSIAPGVLDARRCLAWLVQAPGVFPAEYRVALGDRIYGCDECQEVCPVNRGPPSRGPAARAEPSPRRGD